MVIVAIALCTRSGAIVVSRQFLPVTRQRIETLLSQFPRLLQAGQQHTFVETEEVRFIYQPLEAHYLVMITSRASNILQDMDTLRLLSRVVGEYCGGGVNETESLRDNSLEIVAAFDEIVSLGWRESVNLTQLHTILAMESQEEIVQEIIAKEAKEVAKRKLKQMELEKKEAARRNSAGRTGVYSPVSPSNRMAMETPSFAPPAPAASNEPAIQTTTRGGKGMKLGKKTVMLE